MDGACSMHERDEKCIKNFGQKNLRGRDNLEDLGIDEKVILEQILGKKSGKVWIIFFSCAVYQRYA
jgi:hypothetical protein